MAWDLNADLSSSDILNSPVPTLFADDPDLALPAIQANLINVRADLANFYAASSRPRPWLLKRLSSRSKPQVLSPLLLFI